MTICPHTRHQCHCQPQEGVMCPYGETPKDYPMTNPKRYNLAADTLAGVTEHPEGCFVHWNDYERLVRQIAQSCHDARSDPEFGGCPLAHEPRAPHPDCFTPVPQDRIWALAQEFVDNLGKPEDNEVSMTWNEAVSLLNEVTVSRARNSIALLPPGFVNVAQCASCGVHLEKDARHFSECAAFPGQPVVQHQNRTPSHE